MKKFYLASLCLLIIGVVAMFVGAISGGVRPITGGTGDWHVVDTRAKTTTLNPKKIDNIYLDIDNANVKIQKGDNYSVKATSAESGHIDTKVANGKLTVTEKRNQSGIIFDDHSDGKRTVVITVPNKDSLKSVESHVSDGKVNISGLDLNYLKSGSSNTNVTLDNVHTSSSTSIADSNGSVTANQVDLAKLSLEADDDKLTFNDSTLNNIHTKGSDSNITFENSHLKDFSFTSSSSKYMISGGNVQGSNFANLDDGSINFNQINPDINYNINGDDMKVNVAGQSQKVPYVKNDNNAKNSMQVQGSSAKVSLD